MAYLHVIKLFFFFCEGYDEAQTPTFVCMNLLYPGERVDLHQGVRNADHMHPIHDTLP